MTTLFRLLVVDDHPVVLFGLRLLFAEHPGFRIVAEATTAAQARAAMEAHRPDIVVTDLVMGGRDGIDLVEDLVTIHPPAWVLVYSSLDEARYARLALAGGARGYLSKTAGLERVAEALARIAAGATVVSPAVQASLARPEPEREEAGPDLSGREGQVLDRIGRGASLQAIARELGLSVKTVGTYRERLKIKLGFDGLRALERYAEDRLGGRDRP